MSSTATEQICSLGPLSIEQYHRCSPTAERLELPRVVAHRTKKHTKHPLFLKEAQLAALRLHAVPGTAEHQRQAILAQSVLDPPDHRPEERAGQNPAPPPQRPGSCLLEAGGREHFARTPDPRSPWSHGPPCPERPCVAGSRSSTPCRATLRPGWRRPACSDAAGPGPRLCRSLAAQSLTTLWSRHSAITQATLLSTSERSPTKDGTKTRAGSAQRGDQPVWTLPSDRSRSQHSSIDTL